MAFATASNAQAVPAGVPVYMEERFDPSMGMPVEGYRSYGTITRGNGETALFDELPLSSAFDPGSYVVSSYMQTLSPSGPDPPSGFCSIPLTLTLPDPVHLIVL